MQSETTELGSQMGQNAAEEGMKEGILRAEIDTSAPFGSVKEAVNRFGGSGHWKPSHQHKFTESEHDMEEIDIAKAEEQASLLEKDLMLKERETLDVLKELEATKTMVEELKLKLQMEAREVNVTLESDVNDGIVTSASKEEKKDDIRILEGGHRSFVGDLGSCPSSSPGLILLELKQAKLNLSRTTSDLAGIRASAVSLNKKLEKERILLEKTRQRLILNSSKISSLEEDLNQTKLKLQLAKHADVQSSFDNPVEISKELQRLSSEAEQFKRMGEAAKSEVLRTLSELEQTKSKIKTAEIKLVAARKMKQAARAAEAVALSEIKALSCHENSSADTSQKPEGVTLTFEEYSSLTEKARDAEDQSKTKIIDAMLQVDEANVSNMEILKKVEEAAKEIKTSKEALEEALNKVEAANREKLAVEDALRKWRSEHGHRRRRSVQSSNKFKNSHHRRDSRLLDVNGLNLATDGSTPVLKPTLSIGQILSRKLLVPEDFATGLPSEKGTKKHKVSLGQMLSKPNGDVPSSWKIEREGSQKEFPGKRKKFGFARFSLLLSKQSKKKKKPSPNLG